MLARMDKEIRAGKAGWLKPADTDQLLKNHAYPHYGTLHLTNAFSFSTIADGTFGIRKRLTLYLTLEIVIGGHNTLDSAGPSTKAGSVFGPTQSRLFS